MRAIRLFAPESFTRIVLVDILLIAASFYASAYGTLLVDPSIFFLEEGGALRLAPVVLVMLLAMYFADLYSRKPLASRIFLLQQLSLAGGVALLFQAVVSYVNQSWILPKALMLAGVILGIAALFAWRLLLRVIASKVSGARTILILGTDPTVHRIARHIALTPELNYRIAGSLTSVPDDAVGPVLGRVEDLPAVVSRIQPHMIVVAFANSRDRMPIGGMLDLRFSGVTIEEAGAAYETICRRVCARDLRPSRTLFTNDFDPKDEFLIVLLADRLIAASLLLAGAPFALVWTLWHRLRTRSATLVSAPCAGFRGKAFTGRTFRVPDTATASNDAVSNLARALHLDQWPQLWNVLIGNMSMVGPRPEPLRTALELERLFAVYDYRRNARPGITGWAQLHRSPDQPVIDSIDEVEYDLYYVHNQAPSLYAFILLHGLKRRIA